MEEAKRGYKTVSVALKNSSLVLYGSSRLVDAARDIVEKMALYEGVKLAQIMEAVYLQGKKDGSREVFAQMDMAMTSVKKSIPHKRPGRPSKK